MNDNGGYFDSGKPFTRAKWMEVITIYERLLHHGSSCSVIKLAQDAKISSGSAQKAIQFYKNGVIETPDKPAQRIGLVGSRVGLLMEHHFFIYNLYLKCPSLPNDGYVVALRSSYGLDVSPSLIQRWFKNIGPFKGLMRVTSKFPPAKDSREVVELLHEYLDFIGIIDDHTRLVFGDEKPMKEIDIYGTVRRDPFVGDVPDHKCNANSKNMWNILAVVTLKRNVPHVEHVVIDESTNSFHFFDYVTHLVRIGTLARGDIFVVDNCTIHMQGENEYIQEVLFEEVGVLMIPLPPYHPVLNPTALVFNTLLQRLMAKQSRITS